jgi:hypothetical protein
VPVGRIAGVARGAASARRAVVFGVFAFALASCEFGTWQTNPTPSPVRAVHVAVLQTGKVLLVAGSGNNIDAFNAGHFETSIWDPATNTFTSVATPWDAFCAGHAQLADGRLLVAGGTNGYQSILTNNSYSGTFRAYTFNPDTNSYARVANMTTARWYPTQMTLGDGSVLTLAGLGWDGRQTSTAQRFLHNAWTQDQNPPVRDDLSSGQRQAWPLYPGLHLLANGSVFFTSAHTFGTTTPPGTWNLANNTMHGVAGLADPAFTDHAMSVLLPPAQDQKVMILGGGKDDGSSSTDRTAIVDFSKPDPKFTTAAPLDVKKMYVSAVILPDRTVFETGGAPRQAEQGEEYVYSAQIYNPATGTWTKATSPTVPRGYHSSAVLLPDGRVATFGNNPPNKPFEHRIEIYSPEYLSKGTRPKITSVATELNYGGTYPMTTTQAAPIEHVSLIRPMAVTHSVDANQRLVDVPFTVNGDGSLQLSITANPNLAPPGWYMLFATDNTGVPSVASWVKIGGAPGQTVPVPGAPGLLDPVIGPVVNPPGGGVIGG